jgi:hypothetical protein
MLDQLSQTFCEMDDAIALTFGQEYRYPNSPQKIYFLINSNSVWSQVIRWRSVLGELVGQDKAIELSRERSQISE